MALLEVNRLTKCFGGLTALDNLDLSLEEGELLGLIGPNGSGKSTFFNVVTGIYSPTSGKVIFRGEDITSLRSHRVAIKGIARTFQTTTIFKEMTVFENVAVSSYLQRKTGSWGQFFNTHATREDERQVEKIVSEILDYLELTPLRDEQAKNLPHGYLRFLEVAIAMATNPRLMLLDEPVTGLNPTETTAAMKKIKGLRERGVTMIVVEHDMRAIMGLSDRIVAINFGKKIADGAPEEVRKNKDVIDAYLGREE